MKNMHEIDVTISAEDIVSVVSNVTSPFVVVSELVKNGVDANAKNVVVRMDSAKGTITIEDDGDGFTLEEIEILGKVAKSEKKRDSQLFNNQGDMLLGSKGLAVYSVFSLGDKLELWTKSDDGEFAVIWDVGAKIRYGEVENNDLAKGTKITISGIDKDDMVLLSSVKELNKLKHLSIRNFKQDSEIANISIYKDGIPFDITVDNISDLEHEFDAIVTFKYNSSGNKLSYSYVTDDQRVSNSEVTFDLSKPDDLDEIIKNNYKFDLSSVDVKFDDYLTGGLIPIKDIHIPDFEGKWFLKRGRKPQVLNRFESGIRFYVNKFALYNYLNKNNDWLQLTNFSQVRKINDFKQHNVYGYISFDKFDDLSEGMKISNERGGFIEDKYYHKFIDIVYSFVLFPSLGINIAMKNNLFIEDPEEAEESNDSASSDALEDNSENSDGQDDRFDDNSNIEENSDGIDVGSENDNDAPQQEELPTSILNKHILEIEHGQVYYLKNPDILKQEYFSQALVISGKLLIDDNHIISEENPVGEYNVDYFVDSRKETLTIKIKERAIINNRADEQFFATSRYFWGDIDLSDIHELVIELWFYNIWCCYSF